jgi:glycosyltransferase involved in cell wall biosynthesis
MAAGQPDVALLLIALGDSGQPERIGSSELRWLPYESDEHRLARYFQAADVYLHAAHADNFPTTILLALSCGIPVVATAVGGIPEQVRGLVDADGSWPGSSSAPGEATGILVPGKDPEAMALAATALIRDRDLCARLASNAATDARNRFDPELQLDETIQWYRDIAADWAARKVSA